MMMMSVCPAIGDSVLVSSLSSDLESEHKSPCKAVLPLRRQWEESDSVSEKESSSIRGHSQGARHGRSPRGQGSAWRTWWWEV